MHSLNILYFYISDILLYKSTDPNLAYPGEFLHINNQRAHNNHENILLKKANENPQRAHLGPRAPLWTTLLYKHQNTYINLKIKKRSSDSSYKHESNFHFAVPFSASKTVSNRFSPRHVPRVPNRRYAHG